MIEFKTIFYKNFQSVGNQGIKVTLNRSMTTLIGGHNGSGKSTLLEAITYGLFGKPLKKITMGGLINATNQKNLIVDISFTKNGKDYRIVRGQKPAKLELYVSDELVDQSASVREYQSKIEYILGMDYKLFTQVVVLNKEKYVPFMDLDASARRKVVEDILDISVFSTMNELVKEKSKIHSTKINDVKFDRERIKERSDGKARLLKEAKDYETDQIDKLKSEISDTLLQIQEDEDKIEAFKVKLELLSDAQTKLNKLNDLKREYDNVSAKFMVNVKNLDETIKFYKENDICHTCKSELTEENKNKHINVCNSKLQDIKNNSQSMIPVYQGVLSDISIQESRLNEYKNIQSEIRLLNSSIDIHKRRISQLNASIEASKKSVKVSDIQAEYDEVTKQLNDLTVELNTLIDEELTINLCKVMLKDDGIKASIVKDYIEFINSRLNEMLCSMEFYINITLDENFNDTINAVNKKSFTYDNLSTGQKTRVNLAIWLALIEVASIKNSVVTNILFLDEILENLDAEGVKLFMALVKDKLPHKNTFVVTQRFDEFKDFFRSELKFKLVEGFTEII